MTYQITISPILLDQTKYVCKWQIEQINSLKKESPKISNGEIRPQEFNSDQISFIAEKITKLCEIKFEPKEKSVDLKFDFTNLNNEEKEISMIDLFRLYGLLSMKLNPLAIYMPPLWPPSN